MANRRRRPNKGYYTLLSKGKILPRCQTVLEEVRLKSCIANYKTFDFTSSGKFSDPDIDEPVFVNSPGQLKNRNSYRKDSFVWRNSWHKEERWSSHRYCTAVTVVIAMRCIYECACALLLNYMQGSQKEYLVQWSGYPMEACSWERASNIGTQLKWYIMCCYCLETLEIIEVHDMP